MSISLKFSGLALAGLALAVSPGLSRQGLGPTAAAQAPSWCTPGARHNILWNGTWYAGIVKAAPDASGKCLIGYDGYGANWDERVGPDRLAPPGQKRAAAAPALALAPAPAAAGPASAVRSPAGPKLGKYHCVFFVNGGLTTTPGFTLKAGGAYGHDTGGGGTVRYDQASGVLDFVGGPLAGQAGKVEPKVVRIFNERRSRTVMDCDTP
jgi:hypothetical protein